MLLRWVTSKTCIRARQNVRSLLLKTTGRYEKARTDGTTYNTIQFAINFPHGVPATSPNARSTRSHLRRKLIIFTACRLFNLGIVIIFGHSNTKTHLSQNLPPTTHLHHPLFRYRPLEPLHLASPGPHTAPLGAPVVEKNEWKVERERSREKRNDVNKRIESRERFADQDR